MDQAETPEDWSAVADRHLADAEVLARSGTPEGAYQQAGEAVECACKAAFLRRSGLDHWPARSQRPDVYTHDLKRLLTCAGLDAGFRDALRTSKALQRAWLEFRDWDIAIRYRKGGVSRLVAASAVTSARRIIAWLSMS